MKDNSIVGTCVVCRGTLTDHFNNKGAWVGCGKLPRGAKTGVLFLPFIPITAEALHAQSMTAVQEPASTFREAAERVGRKRMASAQPKELSEAQVAAQHTADETSTARRGRAAGKYFAKDKEPNKVRTESVMAVYKALKAHKRGLSAKDVAERLSMPLGTVGWAIRWLVKQNAASYQAA